MRGVYTFNVQASGIADARTLILFEVPSNMCAEILSASITDLTYDTSEQLEAGLFRVSALGAPTFDAIANVEKHEQGDATNSVVASGSISTTSAEPTYQTTPIDRQGFNNLAGYKYDPIPEERPVISPSTHVGLRLLETPTSSSFSAQIILREIGG
jgi:hypothetical protein